MQPTSGFEQISIANQSCHSTFNRIKITKSTDSSDNKHFLITHFATLTLSTGWLPCSYLPLRLVDQISKQAPLKDAMLFQREMSALWTASQRTLTNARSLTRKSLGLPMQLVTTSLLLFVHFRTGQQPTGVLSFVRCIFAPCCTKSGISTRGFACCALSIRVPVTR